MALHRLTLPRLWVVVALACCSCGGHEDSVQEVPPLLPIAVGNSWQYSFGYADTVRSEAVIDGNIWYDTYGVAFPAIGSHFLMRVDDKERYWIRYNNVESIALDPDWAIQEAHVIDVGEAGPDADRFTSRIHTKHLTVVAFGDTLKDCYIVNFQERGSFGGNWSIVMARGIGTVSIHEAHLAPLQLLSYTLEGIALP